MFSFRNGYSAYWRKNTSPIENWELAYLLKALRKAARYIMPHMKPIEWSGMSSLEDSKVSLDISFVLGEYPVPFGKVDALVGWVAHEALHSREMSNFVIYKAKHYIKDFPLNRQNIFLEMINAGEDIYVNNVAKDTIWQFYLHRAWKWYYPYIRRNKGSITLILFDVWRKVFFQKRFVLPPDLLGLTEALNVLIKYGRLIINTKEKYKGSLLDKAIKRFEFYKELWSLLCPLIKNWEKNIVFEFPNIESSNIYTNNEISDLKDSSNEVSIPRRDIEQIKEILMSEEDITSQIKEIIHDSSAVIPTFFWEENTLCRVSSDVNVVKKLRSIFESQKQRNKRQIRAVNRGLPFGKLDSRRLYKLYIDGKIFKEREYDFQQYWNIVILVDASISMSINKQKKETDNWYNVQKVFSSIYEAAKGYKNRLNLFAYYEQSGRCFVSNLLRDGRLYTLSPRGKTPSGQAIMAVALTLITSIRKKNLIIHITDGESNCGIDVSEAIKFCEKKRINLITIGYGYNDHIKDYLKSTYKNIYFMNSFDELPIALENLLKSHLLKQI